MLHLPSRAVNYHWPGPNALERKFVSLIEEQNDDEVGAIRHSYRQSRLSVKKEVQVSLLRVALTRLILVLAVAKTNWIGF